MRLIVGLTAHVDAGKTTLSEAMLHLAGAIRRAGRVDHGDAFLDTDAIEKERGITIFSKQAELDWKKRPLTLIDTPGHTDFSGETERALRVMDCAVLVISAVDGIQSHTKTIWKLLEKERVPVFLFINKTDRPEAQTGIPGSVRELCGGALAEWGSADFQEQAAMGDEAALDYYLRQGEIPAFKINAMIAQRKLFPVFFGSALQEEGVEGLLDALAAFEPERPPRSEFAATVYKIARDARGARLTFLKVTGGVLKVRDMLCAADGSWAEKAAEIRFYSGAKYRTAQEAEAGEVCAVTGLTRSRSGEGIGKGQDAGAAFLAPVWTQSVMPEAGEDRDRVYQALRALEEEEPLLHVRRDEDGKGLSVETMGEVQLEVLQRRLADAGIHVRFGEERVIYRETIAGTAEGAGHYEPLRHYAEVHLLLEKGERGSGLEFRTAVKTDDLALNWQRLILTHLKEKQHRGTLTGAALTDTRITLVAGRAHLKHTEGGDFRQATYRAVRQGLMKAGCELLEPYVALELEVPESCLGRALHDIGLMGAQPETEGSGTVRVTARVPARRVRGYARELAAYTRGQGKLRMTPAGYELCPDGKEIAAGIGYRPEADLENTADSVFCSHGAGVSVPWNEADAMMHLPMLEEAKADAPANTVIRSRGTQYRGTEEEDRELAAIFERTYGKAKSRELFAPAAKPAPRQEPEKPSAPVLPGREIVLVDGYNIIFAWEELKKRAQKDIDGARGQLADLLCNWRGVTGCDVILVYDAYRVPGGAGSVEKYGNIYVVYTKEAETADSYIEKTALGVKDAPLRVRVATSDGAEQAIILGRGALRVSAREFHAEVEQAIRGIERFLAMNNRRLPDRRLEEAYKNAWTAQRRGEERKEQKAQETEREEKRPV